MALTAGTRLGPYEILAPLGAGGMGEVYRARDTTLNRDVAIKILPELFASDPERLARFEREARVLASLNHPNIAQIHGLEKANGIQALVLELVEGADLSQRIARGAIPLEEALPIAKQIAEALEAAHEQGIIHRDLKPANIKVRDDGAVKVLDFGLAKAMEPASALRASAGHAPGDAQGVAFSQSPTVTTPAMMTGVGMILGTAAYMSPDQAKGRPADKRSDVWAFGCVLYEMLTGRRAFEGEDVSDTLAAVLRGEPDWTKLPATVPPAIRMLVQRCLVKDRRQRIADIAVAQYVLNEAGSLAVTPGPPDPAYLHTRVEAAVSTTRREVTRTWRRRLAVVSATLLVGGTAVAATIWFATRPAAPQVSRMTIATTGTAGLTIGGLDRDLAITPDGRRVAYIGNNGTQLFVRALDALDPVAIATGTDLRGPFVSADGQWVGFAGGTTVLKKVALTGGPPITVAGTDGFMRGATWALDDTILFATNNGTTGLQRVSAAGGTPEVLTHPDHAAGEADHLWPELLPGGAAVLFTIFTITGPGGLDTAQIAVRDLRTGTQKTLVRGGSHAHYVRSGHLIYTAGGTLRAVGFDLSRLETRGTAVPVVPRVVTTTTGGGDFGVATDGTLVYVDAPGGGATRTLVWVDRRGQEEPLAAPPRAYQMPRLSPDGTRVAVRSFDEQDDLWVWDVQRATLARLTGEPGQDSWPVWTPDGRRIIFSADRGGGDPNLWWQAADGTGAAERLTTSRNNQFATGIAPDGTALVFNEVVNPTTGRDLMRLALDRTRTIATLLQTKFDERNGTVSPDGHWLAYDSDSSGRPEVYVRPFPNASDGLWQVSTMGGTRALFARSGRELFFLGPDGALMRVPVDARGTMWSAGTPVKVLDGRYVTAGVGRSYDVSPDGQRFLMIKVAGSDATAAPPSIVVVQHFDAELTRLVPNR